MHFEGTFVTRVPRDKVFTFLMNPEQLAGCLPDVQKLEAKSPDEYTAVVRAGISFIKGEFTMHIRIEDRRPPSHAKLVARGSGIGSTVDIEGGMDLSESDAGTTMKWQVEANVGGRIASVGQRLIGGQAEKIAKQFFDCIKGKLESS